MASSYDGTIKIMTAVDPLGIRKGLSDITSSITGLSRTISSASSGMFSGLQSGFASTARGANSLNSALTKIAATIATVVSAKALIDFARDSIELGSDLIEMENVTNTVFGSMSGAVDAWAKNASRTAGQTEKQAKNYIGTLGAMAKAFGYGTEEAYAMSTTLTQLTGDVASFYNLDQDEAFNKMKAVFTGETESLKSLGVVMTQAALDEFALANGFGKVTAKMTEAEKVALRYRFIQEKLSAASGDFVRTQDSWANQMKQLKLNIQEIMSNLGQGLINVLLPFVKAINMLLGRLGTLANSFKSFSELLTGKKSSGPTGSAQAGLQELTGNLDDSTDATIKYSDATKDAAKANKKYLSSLDEMNRWQSEATPEEPGSGLGDALSWLGDVDYGNLADGETAIDRFSSALQRLAEAVKKGDWEKIGDTIMNALSNMIEKIDWNKIYEKAESFGTGLASFLNGLINPRLFWDLGRTIANAINTALTAANAFAVTFDFTNLGKTLAMGLISFLTNIDWNTLLSAATNWAKGIADALNGFLNPSTFRTVGQSIARLLNTAVTAAFTLGSELEWADIGDGIAAGINAAIEEFDFEKVAESFNVWAEGFLDLLIHAIGGVDWFKLGLKIRNALLKVKWGVLLRRVARLIWTVLSGALKTLAGLFFDADSITNPISDALGDVEETLSSFVEDVDWESISTSISSIAESLTPFVEGFGAGFLEFFNGILEIGVEVLKTIGEALATIAEKLGEVDPDTLEKVGSVLGTIAATVLTYMLATKIKDVFSALGGGLGTIGETVKKNPITAIWFALTTIVEVLKELGLLPDGWEKPLIAGITAVCSAITVGRWVKKIADFFSGKAAQKVISDAVTKTVGGGITEGVAKASVSQTIGTAMKGLWSTVLVPLGSAALVAAIAVGVGALVTAGIKKAAGLVEMMQGGNGELTPAGISAQTWIESLGLSNEEVQELWSKIEQWETEGVDPAELFKNVTIELEKLGVSAEQAQHALENYNVVGSSTSENMILMQAATESLGEGFSNYSDRVNMGAYSANDAYALLKDVVYDFRDASGAGYDAFSELDKILNSTDYTSPQAQLDAMIKHMNTLDGVTEGYGPTAEEFLRIMKEQYPEAFQNVTTNADTAADSINGVATASSNAEEAAHNMATSTDTSMTNASTSVSTAADSMTEDMNATAEAANGASTAISGATSQAPDVEDLNTWATTAAGNADTLAESADGAATSEGSMGSEYIGFVNEATQKTREFSSVSGNVASVGDAAGGTAEQTLAMSDTFKTELNNMDTRSKTAASSVTGHIGSIATAAGDMQESIGSSIDGVSDSIDSAVTTVETQGNNVSNWVSGWADEMAAEVRDDGVNITEGLASGLEDETAKNGLLNTLKDVFGMPDDEIVAMYGISSPSKVMHDYGQYMVQGLADGIQSMRTYLYNAFSDVLSSLPNAITSLQHDLAWRLNSMIDGAESAQHAMADALSFEKTLSDKFAQLTGWKSIRVRVPYNYVGYRVPYLATGAVIPPNSPFLAMMGDQKSGTNIEAPLSTIKQAVIEALGEQKRGGSYEFVAQLNRRTIFDEVIEEAKMRQMQSGSNPFDLA